MEQAQDEMDLLARAVAGETRALELLLGAHHQRLAQYVSRHLPAEWRGVVEPRDVVQDTLFEACRLIGNFKPEGADCVYRWLATIARHQLVDLVRSLRARRRQQGLTDDPVATVAPLIEELAVYRRTPSRSAASHELLAAVEQAIARLPQDHRRAVTLRHLEGLSVAETAVRMGRTQDAVYWLCWRALRAIRADLQSGSQFL